MNNHLIWQGFLDEDGYGQVKDQDNKTRLAHRIAFELQFNRKPKIIDHLCSIRNCVSITCLDDTTQKINILRGNSGKINNWNKSSSFCIKCKTLKMMCNKCKINTKK